MTFTKTATNENHSYMEFCILQIKNVIESDDEKIKTCYCNKMFYVKLPICIQDLYVCDDDVVI